MGPFNLIGDDYETYKGIIWVDGVLRLHTYCAEHNRSNTCNGVNSITQTIETKEFV